MAKAYIPKDIFGNPIPEDALLDEIRSRHGGGSLPQSETQRLVSELDLSAREEETWKSLREDEERRIKALGKREENLNWALDRVITDSLRGFGKQRHTTYEENGTVIQSFKDDPDWEQYVEDIKEDIFLDVGRAAARFTEWDYTKYKGGKEWIKKERDALLQRLLTEYGLPENIAESIVAGALGVGKLFHERELDIHRQRIQLGDDVEAAVSGHINIKDPDDPSVQYGAGVSAGDLFGIKGFDAEVEAKGDLADQIIRQVEGSVGYQDEGFSASVGASGDPTRPEYGRVEGELETQDLLGAGERINVGVTGYPLREHPSARFDIDAGVPLGRGRISGQARGNIEQGPTDVGFDYFLPVGETGRLIAGASTDPRDPYGKLAANVRYKANWDKGGIVDLQTNETASEVLAQSNTKTPDFMAPVLSSDPQPFREGGIASLPNNPVLAGQQHMLAYITPEEASTLRAQGGGVTPTGGQYRGPGGIASFWVGFGGPTGMGSTSGSAGGTPGGTGEGGHGKYGLGDPAEPQVSDAVDAHNAELAQAVADDVAEVTTQMQKDPRSLDYSLNESLASLRSSLAATGMAPGATSKANLSASIGETDALGNTTLGFIDTRTGKEYSKSDIDAMSLGQFNATFTGNPAIGTIGDPESPLGMAVLGLGTTGLGMLSPALSLPTTAINVAYGLANPDDPSLGFMGLVEQGYKGLFGETPGETAGDVSEAIGLGKTPFADVTGYIGDAAGTVAESLGLSDAFGTPTPSTATTPNVPGGPGFPVMQIPSVEIGLQVPPTAAEVLTGPLPHYTAEQLAAQTGVTVAQAQQYLSGLPT